MSPAKQYWGFLLLGITSAVLGAYRLAPHLTSPQPLTTVPAVEDGEFMRTHGRMIRSLAAGPRGTLLTRHYDHTVGKWSRDGRRVWEVPFASLRDLTPLSVNDLAVAEDDTISVLGITASLPPQTAIYRIVEQGAVPQIAELARIPQFEGASLAALPDGTLLVLGLELAELHRLCLSADKGSGIQPPDLPLLHEVDPDGKLVRSFRPHRFSARTVEDLTGELTDLLETRVVASPEGEIYLWHPFHPILESVDRETGETIGRIPLPYSGVREAQIWGVNFASASRLIYTVVFSPPVGSVNGYEVRTLDLPTGESEVLDRSEQSVVVEGWWDRESQQVALIHKAGGQNGKGPAPGIRYRQLGPPPGT